MPFIPKKLCKYDITDASQLHSESSSETNYQPNKEADQLHDDKSDDNHLSAESEHEELSDEFDFSIHDSEDDIDISVDADGGVESVLLSADRWRAVIELKQQFDVMQTNMQQQQNEVQRAHKENDMIRRKHAQIIAQFETDREADHANYQRAVKDYSIESKRAQDAVKLAEQLQNELNTIKSELQHIQREREIRVSEVTCEREVSESLRAKVQALEEEKQSRTQLRSIKDANGKVVTDGSQMSEADCWSSLSLVTMERDVLKKKVNRIEGELAEAKQLNESLARTNRDQLHRIESIERQITELNESQSQLKHLPIDNSDQTSALDQMEISLLRESVKMLNDELDFVRAQKPSKWRCMLPLVSVSVLSSLAALIV